MSGRSLLSRTRRRYNRRPATVQAVYEEDLWGLLDKLALLDPLEGGRLTCPVTGEVLNRDNLGGIVGAPTGPVLVSEVGLTRMQADRAPV
jgi:hypothetical protein